MEYYTFALITRSFRKQCTELQKLRSLVFRKLKSRFRQKKITGRLALQFLIRDTLMAPGRISNETYNKYLELASELHRAGYTYGKSINKEFPEGALQFAEELYYTAKTWGISPRR